MDTLSRVFHKPQNPSHPRMKIKTRPIPFFATLPLWLIAAALAAQAPAPDADVVLRRMSDYLAGLEALEFRASVTFDDVPAEGVKLQYSGSMDVFLRRPSQLHVDYRDDLSARQVWLDGESFTIVDPVEGLWARVESRASLDVTLDRLATDHGHSVPLDDLLGEDPYSKLTAGVKAQRNLGLRKVGGTDCHHLVFGREDLTWQIWVDAGDRPLPRKLVITYTSLPLAPQYTAVLTGWDPGTRLPDSRFQPVIPDGADRIDLASREVTQP